MFQNKNVSQIDLSALKDPRMYGDVRVARVNAHEKFDYLWKTKKMSRSVAYRWLAANMGLSKKDAHIRFFTAAQCMRVEDLVDAYLRGLRGN